MRIPLLGLSFLSLAGCVAIAAPSPPALAGVHHCDIGKPMIETRLFMGTASPKGPVSPDAFQHFVDAEVTPRWKEGYTILDGQGLWLSEARHVTEHEQTHILMRVHEPGAAASADIEAIRAAYIKAFAQDAVGRIDREVCADF